MSYATPAMVKGEVLYQNVFFDNLLQSGELITYVNESRKNWAFVLYSVQTDYAAITAALSLMAGSIVTYIPHIDILTDSYDCWLSCFEDVINDFPSKKFIVRLTTKTGF